jgi:hypothetical protein
MLLSDQMSGQLFRSTVQERGCDLFKGMVAEDHRKLQDSGSLAGIFRLRARYFAARSSNLLTIVFKFPLSRKEVSVTVDARSGALALVARALESWVQISLKAWMSVHVSVCFADLCR